MLNLGVPLTYVHNLNPFALRFTETFGIRWYALAYLLGFYATYRLVVWLARKNLSPLTPEMAGDFIFTAALGTIIGGRLGYCFFYSPELLTQITSSFPYWGVIAINRGGMASHGGMLGIVVACIWFGRTRHIPIRHLFDLAALGGPIGILFGRIANFINGELVGRPAPADLPWAVKFPQDIYQWSADQLQSLGPVVDAAGVSVAKWNEWLQQMSFSWAAQQNIETALNLIITKIQQGNTLVLNLLAPLLVPRHPSQLYEAFGEGIFLFAALFYLWRKPRVPGVVSSAFLILYAIVRIIGEQFRMPDPQLGFQIFGATRGQILSVVALVTGLVCLGVWSRAATPKIGGWGKR
jgi:phosphatidylglycerol---prolipoprotein diacylglyceryl transferase